MEIFSYLCDYLLICLLLCLFHFEGIQTGESHRDKAAVGVIDYLNVFPWRQFETTSQAAKIFWLGKKKYISRSCSNYAGSKVILQCLHFRFVLDGIENTIGNIKKRKHKGKNTVPATKL